MNLLTKRDEALKGSTCTYASQATGGAIASLLSGSAASERAALVARSKCAESQEIEVARLLELILVVPIKRIDGEAAGVLQLSNARDSMTKKVKVFSAADQRAAESFAAQAALVMKKKSPPAAERKRRSR